MKRPQQHIIESKSKKKFEGLIPDTWVARELGADYGLDYLIEIFKNNNSTGQLFFVQLKGTDAEIIDDSISYQLSIDNIEYWNTITNPVLLVFYSSKSDKFWGIWTNELKENVSSKKKNQEKLTIKLNVKNLLSSTFFTQLENVFNDALPFKINVSYDGNSNETKLLHQCLEKWLKYFFNDDVQFENHTLPNTFAITYSITTPSLLEIQVTTKGKIHHLQPVKFLGKENYLFLPDIEAGKIPEPLSECLMLFALSNCEKNIKGALRLVQSTISDLTDGHLTMESLLTLTRAAIHQELISELHELAKTLVNSNRTNEFQFLNSSILFLEKDHSWSRLYQANLKFAIEKVSILKTKGIFSYNLANSLRAAGDHYSASLNYQNARKYEPKYKERSYWWFEYAGVLFLSGHPKIAEAFYLKSYEMDNEQNIPLIFGLVGDCRFFQGKFEKSTEYFNKLIEHIKKPGSFNGLILKSIIAKYLTALKLDQLRIDNVLSDKLTQEGLDKNQEELFEKAIIANPLNGLAWFNHSVSLNSKGDLEQALFAFATTACIQSWDSEAWRNALLLAFSTNHFDMFSVIYGAAHEKIGSEFLNHISQSILDQPNLSIDQKRELIKSFTELSKEYAKENNSLSYQ